MSFDSKNSSGFQPNRCMVCETAIVVNPLNREQPKVCGNVQCQQLYKQRLQMNPTLYQKHFTRQKQLIMRKKHAEQEKQKHILRIKNNEHEENQQVKGRLLESNSSLKQKKIRVTQLPCGLSDTNQVLPERIEEYHQHLKDVVDQADSADSIDDLLDDQARATHDSLVQQDANIQGNPALLSEVNDMCTLCKGGCCSAGGNHAYINPVTIRRLLDNNPELTATGLLNYYCEATPDISVVGACINQTANGCSLPREYRSDTCNLYLCDELQDHLDWMNHPDSQEQTSLVIQRSNTNWNRYEAVEKNPIIQVFVEDEPGNLQPIDHESLLD